MADQIKDQFKEKIDKINNDLLAIPGMQELKDKTGAPPGAFLLAALLLCVVMVAFNLFGIQELIVSAICIGYPVFRSIKALETKDDDEDDK